MPWRLLDPQTVADSVREMTAATWVLDGDGYVMNVPEWAALTGQTPEEAEGDGWMDAVHPDDAARVGAAWQTAIAHGTPFNTDYRLRCADGRYRWFNARAVPTINNDGEVRQWVGMVLAIAGAMRPSRAQGRIATAPANRFDDISPGALRAARGLLGWSTDQLAQAAGISRSTLRRLEEEGSRSTPRRANVEKVLRALSKQSLQCIGSEGKIIGIADKTLNALQAEN